MTIGISIGKYLSGILAYILLKGETMSLAVLQQMLVDCGKVTTDQYRVETMNCEHHKGCRNPTCDSHFWLYPHPGADITAMEIVCAEFSRTRVFLGSAEVVISEEIGGILGAARLWRQRYENRK